MHAQDAKICLLQAGVNKLYHCNSVVTSLSYIQCGGLLSRQTAENMGLPQTSQETDTTDKALGIYNDVFFDSVDIHERAHRTNDYGAVLFIYSIDVLDSLLTYDIGITYDNPIRWDIEMSEEKRYLQSPSDFFFFNKGNFCQHITVRNISTPLSFDYLEEIVIDNPGEERCSYLDNAVACLVDALRRQNLDIPLRIRTCPASCSCMEKYQNSKPGYTYHRFKTSI